MIKNNWKGKYIIKLIDNVNDLDDCYYVTKIKPKVFKKIFESIKQNDDYVTDLDNELKKLDPDFDIIYDDLCIILNDEDLEDN